MRRSHFLGAGAAAAAAICLLWKTQEVAAGVQAGLENCAGVLIPSLFPFMILAGLITSTGAGGALSRSVSVFSHRVLNMPENMGAVLLMSFLGGFPVGARMLSDMLARGETDRDTASRALCCCVNAGPSFLISAVGAGLLHSRTAGLLLLAAQLLSAFIVGAFVFSGAHAGRPAAGPHHRFPSEHGAFVAAVRSASASMLSVCAFVVAFAAITALLSAVGAVGMLAQSLGALFPALGAPFFSAALSGVLEVTNGCIQASALGGRAGFTLCAFLTSFSSLSIVFQVRACFSQENLPRFGPFYRSRLAHGAITALLANLFYQLLPAQTLSVMAAGSARAAAVPDTPNRLVTALCLICMCAILLPDGPRKRIHMTE